MNHRSDVIFLKGLPDVPESRPHSSVNALLEKSSSLDFSSRVNEHAKGGGVNR
ncbi:MAG: hypothetical protein R6V85_05260 [Polyangia bacterium]